MKNRTLARVALVSGLALVLAPGCGGRSPTAPAEATPPAATVTVTGVQPSTGSTNGTTAVTVVNSTRITATVPTHAAGTVDAVVTNPGAQSGTLTFLPSG